MRLTERQTRGAGGRGKQLRLISSVSSPVNCVDCMLNLSMQSTQPTLKSSNVCLCEDGVVGSFFGQSVCFDLRRKKKEILWGCSIQSKNKDKTKQNKNCCEKHQNELTEGYFFQLASTQWLFSWRISRDVLCLFNMQTFGKVPQFH